MLIDELINACTDAYDRSNAGKCGVTCNNMESCVGICDGTDGCLDQVHWWPKKGGRSDYKCKKLLWCYVQRFSQRYSENILSIAQDIDFSRYPRFDIVSIGCGAAPDLMAFEQIAGFRPIHYLGYESNELWDGIHTLIKNYTAKKENIKVDIMPLNIFDVLADGQPAHHSYNIVVIQFLISHLYNNSEGGRIDNLYEGIINKIIRTRQTNSPFLIIINDVDSISRGRNTFYQFLNMLETAGYSGRAYAKSYYETGDLGRDRWHIDIYNRNGIIKYEYEQCPSEHSGAQLVIELR